MSSTIGLIAADGPTVPPGASGPPSISPPNSPVPYTPAFVGNHAKLSPNGNEVVYSNWAAGGGYNSDLFVYNINTQTTAQITSHGTGEAFIRANWSPDGNRLAVTWRTPNGGNDIAVMTRVGDTWSAPVNVTPEWFGSDEDYATWTPDGNFLVFQSDRDGLGNVTINHDIWVMQADGTGRVNLTNTPGIDEVNPMAGVPEPSVFVLLGAGVFGLLGYAWRRAKQSVVNTHT